MSKTYKILITFCLMTAFIFLGGVSLTATHIVGGELTYRCLGNNQYEVTVVVRRDCENGADDAEFDDPAIIGVYDIFGALQLAIGNLGTLQVPLTVDDTLANDQVFDCSVLGGLVCVHETVYRDTVTLPWNKIGYILAYQRCCRNSIINNIIDPLETGATYFSRIEAEALNQCNSQPVFNNWPDVYACVDQELVFDHSAIDPDGDSLVYRLCTPTAGASIDNPKPIPLAPPYPEVEFLPPYGLNNMMGGDPVRINSRTGELTAKPNLVGTYLIGVCVDEYRDGVLISTVRRDFEYNVRACSDPVIADFDVLENDCDGDTKVKFENLSVGGDQYKWHFDYPNPNFNPNPNPDPAFMSDEFSPEFEYPANGAYTVRLVVTRDSDGCSSIEEKTIVISDTPLDADFTASFESCDGGNNVVLNDASKDPLGISKAESWDWSVDINGSITNLTGNPAVFDAGTADSIIVTLTVTSNAGCTSTVTKTINIADLFPDADFETTLKGCSQNAYELQFDYISLTNIPLTSVEWTIDDNGSISQLNGESVSITSTAEDLTVTMLATYDNGCTVEIIRDITEEDFLPELTLVNDLADPCIGEDSVKVTFSGELVGGNMMGNPEAYSWSVDGLVVSSDSILCLDYAGNQSHNIDLAILFDNGCSFAVNEDFATFDTPGLMIQDSVDCEDNTVTITDLSDLTGVNNATWIVDGVSTSDSVLNIQITDDEVVVIRWVEYDNGCIDSDTLIYSPEDFDINLLIGNNYCENCPENEQEVNFFPIINNTSFTNPSYTWIYDEGNGPMTFDGDTLTLTVTRGQMIELTLTVVFDNGCEETVMDKFTAGECDRDLMISEEVDCSDLENIHVTLVDTTVLEPGVTIISQEWTVDGMSILGPEVEFTIQSNPVVVTLNVEYSDGCKGTWSQTYNPEDFQPALDFNVDLLYCEFGIGYFLLSDDSEFPEACLEIESQTWIIDGVTYTGDSITVGIPLGQTVDVEYIITFTNGLTVSTSDDTNPNNDSINTLDYIETVDFEIQDNLNIYCGDSINVSIIDPDSTLTYNWSYDGEFSLIVGTGIDLMITPSEAFSGTIFAQAISDSLCIYGESSLELNDQSIDLSYDMPFEICLGDTAIFEIVNNNPDQEITWEWKDSTGYLIEGDTTNSPLIGIPLDSIDDFFMVLCKENQFGCTRLDTIFFEIGDHDDLEPFTYELDSCGTTTINFMSNNTGDLHWDFGDGNSSMENNPSHTYGAPGTYLVTLSDSSDVCPQNTYMDSITVPEFIEINIGQDTIEYSAGDTVMVTATTNGDPNLIEWCLEDGTNIYTGNPLVYAPMDSIVKVYAKITDAYGCSDTTCTVLKLRDDCPDDLMIDGPDVVCVGDTFELLLIMDQDLSLFSYLWDPSECIVSGGDTHNPTVTTNETKTFSVLVTREGCEDTIISRTVEVSMPEVTITTETGEPEVCLGENISLLVIPDDPNCTYTWSTGETGSEIIVSPEVTTSYSVTCIDIYGCEAMTEFTLEVIQPRCDESDVYLPNAFSPNGDNVNDILFVRSKFIDQMDLQIVNRWGEEVFRSFDQRDGWDGTYKGEALAPDAYAYCLKVTCINGTEYVTGGNVSIIK